MFTRYFITKTAYNDIKDLDYATKKRLKDKLELFMLDDNPLARATKLQDKKAGTYRFRIGDFRIIFDVHKATLVILRFQHRKDLYRK